MSILYHPFKANVAAHCLSRLCMGITTHFEKHKKESAHGVHRLTWLVVQIMVLHKRMNSGDKWGWILICVRSKRKARRRSFFCLLEIMTSVHRQKLLAYDQGEDSVVTYEGGLSDLDDHLSHIELLTTIVTTLASKWLHMKLFMWEGANLLWDDLKLVKHGW